MAAPAVGATASTLYLASLGNLRPGILWICSCVLGFALFLAMFAFSHYFLFSLGLLAIVGLARALRDRRLAKRADERYQTAKELREDLAALRPRPRRGFGSLVKRLFG